MGNPKQKWTSEEEDALRKGVAKHGTGKWKDIQRDPEFNRHLFSRSNIDLKDKWRNMVGGGSGQGARDKSRTAKAKASLDAPSAALPTAQAVSVVPVPDDAVDAKSAPKYDAMIFDALSTMKDPNGLDTGAIFGYIERRHEVPPNFRRLLSSRLRRLVARDKLEKVNNCFKIKDDTSFGTKTPAPREKDVKPKPVQCDDSIFGGTLEETAVAAAYKIAEAENKSFVAAEAVKEAERVSRMAEDAESTLQLAREILDRCSGDQIMLAA